MPSLSRIEVTLPDHDGTSFVGGFDNNIWVVMERVVQKGWDWSG